MLNFVSKLYQSIIARDQMVKLFVKRHNIKFVTHCSVRGYDDFDNQANALQNTRAYRKIALKASSLGRPQPEKFFYKNYVTRDLVNDSRNESNAEDIAKNVLIELLVLLFKILTKALFEKPPPLKSSLIPDINLSARLLPTPILMSA